PPGRTRLDGEHVRQVCVLGRELLLGGFHQVTQGVTHTDPMKPKTLQCGCHIGRGCAGEQHVGGTVVTDDDTEVHQIFQCHADRIPELSDPDRSPDDVDPGTHRQFFRTVQFPFSDAVEGDDGKGYFHQRGGGKFHIGFNADLLSRAKITHEEGAEQIRILQLFTKGAQKRFGLHPRPPDATAPTQSAIPSQIWERRRSRSSPPVVNTAKPRTSSSSPTGVQCNPSSRACSTEPRTKSSDPRAAAAAAETLCATRT